MCIFSGTPSRDSRIKRDSALSPRNKPGRLLFYPFFQKVCFAVQIPRKLDICMKTNIILPGKNDSSISDRQVRDCPDVSEKQFHREYPEDTGRISKGYRRNTIYMKGWSLMCLSKNSEAYVKGIIQRLKHTRD